METPLIPGLERAFPIITPGASDTASFDECLELLHLGGRPIWHAVLMMIPEAWENHATMSAEKRAFYRFHASLMEPWDGPASIAFTDGTVIGAVLDRNGLRPSRYWVTDDDRVIMASETGVVDVDPAHRRPEGPAPAGPHVPRRHRRRGASSTTRRSSPSSPPSIRTPTGSSRASCTSNDLPRARARRSTATSRCSGARRSSATRTKSSRSSSRRWRGRAARRSARWAPTRRSRCSPIARACCSTTSSSCSRRSPTRRSTPSARSWSRRCRARIGAEGNLLEPSPESCRQIELPFPIIDNDELAQAHPRRRPVRAART